MADNDCDGPRWYFTRKEIEENSPSRTDGIDLKKETYLRKSYCTFLQDLGMRLKVPQVTIATAIVFCHRFFLHQSHAKSDRKVNPIHSCPKFERAMNAFGRMYPQQLGGMMEVLVETIATVCMFLAGKVEETPRPLKDVILVSYEIIHKRDAAAIQKIKQKEVYEQQKELILLGERVLLTTLGFDFNVNHPYMPLVEAIKKFKVAQNALAQVAWNFVNDGLRTSLCLQFKPHHIAAGAIFLAAKFLKVKLPTDGEKVWWQEFDVTPRQLEDVSNQMLELYEQNRQGQSSQANEGSTGTWTNHPVTTAVTENSIAPNATQDVGMLNAKQAGQSASSSRTVGGQFHSNSNRIGSQSSQNKSNDNGSTDTKSGVWDRTMNIEGQDCSLHKVEPFSRGRESTAESFSRSKSPVEHLGNANNDLEATEWNTGDQRFGVAMKEHCPPDTISKIDKDKVKAALEKRRKFRKDAMKKSDIIDDDDLIERELENGIELATEDEKLKQERRRGWSRPDNGQEAEDHCFRQAGANDDGKVGVLEHQSPHRRIKSSEARFIPDQGVEADLENGEEDELSSLDEQVVSSAKSSNRKRTLMNSKKQLEYATGLFHHPSGESTGTRWPDHVERDQKRHRFEKDG